MRAPSLYILPLTTIIRTRVLPFSGRVLVRVGQKVSSSDVIAEASISRKHVVVDLAEKLQLTGAKLDANIKVKRGQKITKGDLVAEVGGVFGREVLAPVDGRVAALGGGKLVLETSRAAVEIYAGVVGTVTEVIEERGAVIRASGAIVQGVWGNGKIDAGVLLSLIEKPDDVLDPVRLDVSLRGSVLLTGYVAEAKALKNAAELPVRGLIVSSMAPNLISLARQMPYPILVLDGFGHRPMNSAAFKLLSTNIKRDAAVNALSANKKQGIVPEVFLSLPFNQEPPEAPAVEKFASGQTVHIVSMLQPGRIGTIAFLPEEMSILPSGVRAQSAQVRLESGEEIIVPLSNLEVLG